MPHSLAGDPVVVAVQAVRIAAEHLHGSVDLRAVDVRRVRRHAAGVVGVAAAAARLGRSLCGRLLLAPPPRGGLPALLGSDASGTSALGCARLGGAVAGPCPSGERLGVAALLPFRARTATLRVHHAWPWAQALASAFRRLKRSPCPPDVPPAPTTTSTRTTRAPAPAISAVHTTRPRYPHHAKRPRNQTPTTRVPPAHPDTHHRPPRKLTSRHYRKIRARHTHHAISVGNHTHDATNF